MQVSAPDHAWKLKKTNKQKKHQRQGFNIFNKILSRSSENTKIFAFAPFYILIFSKSLC